MRAKAIAVAIALGCVAPFEAWGHCDSLDGPVVQDARTAFENGDPTPVLKWVAKAHEDEVRDVFRRTMAVRAQGDEAKAIAERYFFETLVRIHRAGEGEGFTGLTDSVTPGIAAADKALRDGSARELAEHMSAAVSDGITKRMAAVRQRRAHATESVEGGRRYVEAYVDYIHFVEALDGLVSHGASHKHEASSDHVHEQDRRR